MSSWMASNLLVSIGLCLACALCQSPALHAESPDVKEEDAYHKAREAMVQDIADSGWSREGVDDKQVLDAMRRVPRHRFVPKDIQRRAYDDRPLPIGHGQTISQPYNVAYMTAVLQVGKDDHALEVGTADGDADVDRRENGLSERNRKRAANGVTLLDEGAHAFARGGVVGESNAGLIVLWQNEAATTTKVLLVFHPIPRQNAGAKVRPHYRLYDRSGFNRVVT